MNYNISQPRLNLILRNGTLSYFENGWKPIRVNPSTFGRNFESFLDSIVIFDVSNLNFEYILSFCQELLTNQESCSTWCLFRKDSKFYKFANLRISQTNDKIRLDLSYCEPTNLNLNEDSILYNPNNGCIKNLSYLLDTSLNIVIPLGVGNDVVTTDIYEKVETLQETIQQLKTQLMELEQRLNG